jgi:hypothetical protein
MIHDCCVYVRNVFVCPLEVLMCFFHKTVKKTSIPAKGAVFVFHKIADTNDDFSFSISQKVCLVGVIQKHSNPVFFMNNLYASCDLCKSYT